MDAPQAFRDRLAIMWEYVRRGLWLYSVARGLIILTTDQGFPSHRSPFHFLSWRSGQPDPWERAHPPQPIPLHPTQLNNAWDWLFFFFFFAHTVVCWAGFRPIAYSTQPLAPVLLLGSVVIWACCWFHLTFIIFPYDCGLLASPTYARRFFFKDTHNIVFPFQI